MNNNIMSLIIVLIVLVFVGIVIAIILPYLKKRGVDVSMIIDQTKKSLDTVNKTLDLIKPFTEDSEIVDAFDKILTAANVGVGQAEQLYNIGQLEPGERKDAARQYVTQAVALMGVAVTPEVEKLIDGAIEAEVLELGHRVELKALGLGTDEFASEEAEPDTVPDDA